VVTVYKEELAKSNATEPSKDLLELVAALLASPRVPKLAIPILKRCAPKTDRMKSICLAFLTGDYTDTQDWTGLVDAVRGLSETDPMFGLLASEQAYALGLLGHLDDGTKLLDQQLAKHPDDLELLRARVRMAVAGTWSDAQPWLDKLLAHPHVSAEDFNGVAWSRLFFDATPDKARDVGARAERLGKPDAALANTLAAIEAESNRPYAAWTYLQTALATRKDELPSIDDWYVIGRMAETYELRDDAIAAYRHVTKPTKRGLSPTGYDFAQRRLAKLGVH
jgi:hypothetical protein